MKTRLMTVLVSVSLCIGCGAPIYANISEVPTAQKSVIDQVDSYYIDIAKKQAAYLAKCESNEIEAEAFYTEGVQVLYPGHYRVMSGKQLSSVGVEACGQRAMYKVICGVGDVYAYDVFPPEKRYGQPCEVVREGTSADAELENTNAEDEEFMRQQQIQQQQQQQQ